MVLYVAIESLIYTMLVTKYNKIPSVRNHIYTPRTMHSEGGLNNMNVHTNGSGLSFPR